jgi:adenylyltransferase/sulfurtransferase
MPELTENDRRRYQRQMMMADWGEAGQRRIHGARVGVVGAGGLGSAVLIYLTAAGFRRITLIDRDRVELSNLNRQVLHWDRDIGRAKVESAAEKLRGMDPLMDLKVHSLEIGPGNADELLQDVDGVIDALDNFESRFLLNEYARRHGIPLFHGAVWGFEGRATTILPDRGPCFRCIYPEAPSSKEVFPVVGVSPALIGVIQVTEAVKFFTGIGESLCGTLLIYDGETMSFLTAEVQRNPRCPVCGKPEPR